MYSALSTTRIIRSMMFVWIAHFIVDFMLGIWPVYKTMAGLDLAKSGLIMGGCAIIGEGLQPYVGNLSDRGYSKWLILLGVLCASAASLLVYTNDYYMIALVFLITYCGSGIFHPAAGGFVTSISGNRRGLWMGVFVSGGAFGLAISQMVFAKAYVVFNGQLIYLLLPSVLLIGWTLYRYGMPRVEESESLQKKRLNIRAVFRLFRHRELSLLYVLLVCNQAVMWALIFLLPDVLKERGYDHWLCYGAGHFAFVIGGAMTMIPAGYLADRYSERRVLLIGSLLGTGSFYFFLFSPVLASWAVLATLFVMGASLYVISPISIALGTRVSSESPGMVSGFLMGMVWMVAESVGPGLSGLVTKFFTVDHASNALICMGVLFFIAIGCISRLSYQSRVTESAILT